MSIATLKRKTKEKYNNSSVGRKGFSINGSTRNQGWVGQMSLSRVHGITSLNDNTYVKASVIGTKGMLMKKFRWIGGPLSVVKPDSNDVNLNSQSSYVTHLRKTALKCIARYDYTLKLSNCNASDDFRLMDASMNIVKIANAVFGESYNLITLTDSNSVSSLLTQQSPGSSVGLCVNAYNSTSNSRVFGFTKTTKYVYWNYRFIMGKSPITIFFYGLKLDNSPYLPSNQYAQVVIAEVSEIKIGTSFTCGKYGKYGKYGINCTTTKSVNTKSQGEYLILLDNICSINDAKNQVKNTYGTPILA